MESFSSNNRINARCNCNKLIVDSICAFCFANKQMSYMPSMEIPYTLNYLLLTYKVLPLEILPIVNRLFCRIESFGDVGNAIHAINYCNLMRANHINNMVTFAAWSKNPDFWYGAFRLTGKPKNLSFGISSLFVNKETKVSKKFEQYVDFVFTVYDSEKEAAKDGYTINCGARHCLSCLRCYSARKTKEQTGKIVKVIEQKK